MNRRFSKLSGAGNDFVLIEGPARPGLKSLAKKLCDRRQGIGADGLLVVSRRPRLKFSYYNADGSATFCGNGSRCAAWWMNRKGWTTGRREFSFASSAGLLLARMAGPATVAIRMPVPEIHKSNLKLNVLGRTFRAHWLDTGVPHAVIFVPRVDKIDVAALGRAVRHHKAFGRAGANADFVASERKGLSVRTFERGVEDETLACGTGATAAALAAYLLGRVRPPVSVRVRSGQSLRVHFTPDGRGFKDVWLEGPVRLVYKGEIRL